MGSRGRKSSEALAVATVKSLDRIERPDAPYDLTDEQADEWRAVTSRLPADWFPRETWPLLSQFCRHVVQARRLAQLITQAEKSEEFNIDDYDKLLKIHERESRAINALSRAMRLAQNTTMRHETTRKPSSSKKPWEA